MLLLAIGVIEWPLFRHITSDNAPFKSIYLSIRRLNAPSDEAGSGSIGQEFDARVFMANRVRAESETLVNHRKIDAEHYRP